MSGRLSGWESPYQRVNDKEYFSGTRAGQREDLTRGEFNELKSDYERLWGRLDWKKDFVPGTLKPTLADFD